MYKSKLAIFIDSIICTIITLLITYSWINRVLKNAFLSLFLANIVSLIVFICLILYFLKNQNKTKFSIKEKNLFDLSLDKIKYSSINFQIDYFCKLLNSTYINEKIYLNNNFYFYVNINQPLSSDDFFKINNYYLSNKLNKQLIIIALTANNDFMEIFNKSPTKYTLLLKQDLFELMKINNAFIPIEEKPQKNYFNKFKQLVKSLSKVKFINLFSSGVSLLLLSFFIPYSFLYLFIGTFLLVLSFINLFSKNKSPKTSNDISIIDIIKK